MTTGVHRPFNASHLKWFAMFAMTADHLAWRFLAYDSHLSELIHFIGRAVAPLMCYFLVIGFYHSRNISHYVKRLAVFAIISQPPFWLFNIGIHTVAEAWHAHTWTDIKFLTSLIYGNVLFSLLFSLIALVIIHDKTLHLWAKLLLIALLYPLISLCDYGFAMIYMTLLFDYFYQRHEPKRLIIAYLLSIPLIYVLIYGFKQTVGLGYMHVGMVLSALFIHGFNGQKGKPIGGRYVFYWFYPLHLFVIALIEFIVIKDYIK